MIVNKSSGKDEWWCNWYYCPNCVQEYAHIAGGFDFCPDCGIELEWPEGAIDGEE